MVTPQTSRHFTRYVNEKNGIESYLLTSSIAPIQQAFYFVNSGFSDDGRYLYLLCAAPPSREHSIGLLDFQTDTLRAIPNTEGSSGWYVEPKTGTLWFTRDDGVCCYSPASDSVPVLRFPWPQSVHDCGVIGHGSHLNFTPDCGELQVDIHTKTGSILGTFHLETGEFIEWYRTPYGTIYSHTQLSPTDPDLMLCAHENFTDPVTGVRTPPPLTEDGIYPRLQLIRRDGSREMRPPFGNYASHEWWAPDGKSIYYCNNNACYTEIPGDGGTFRHHLIVRDRLDRNAPEVIADLPIEDGVGCWHAHCSQDQNYFVTDGSYPSHGLIWWRGCPSVVRFWNNVTKKATDIVTRNPALALWSPEKPCPYHIDPHPRFVLNDTLVSYTTTVRGRVDLALAPVSQLLEATK